MSFFMDQLAQDPSIHIYHYAPYEPTALSRLMGRHATREDEVDQLLRGDVLIGAFWASRFNQDLRRHPLPFSGGFRSWASRSRCHPLAALSLQYDPYWRTLRQVVTQMAGLAITDLSAGTPVPEEPSETEVLTPDPDVGGETDAIAS